MLLVLMLSLVSGVPDDFELPPDIVMYSFAKGQLFVGLWESPLLIEVDEDSFEEDLVEVPALSVADRETADAAGILQNESSEDDRSMLFWPVEGYVDEATGLPRFWTSSPGKDAGERALYFWTDDPLMEEFLSLHGGDTVILEMEAVADSVRASDRTVPAIRVVGVTAGGETFREWAGSR